MSVLHITEEFRRPADTNITDYTVVALLYEVDSIDKIWTAVSLLTFLGFQGDTITANAGFTGNGYEDSALSDIFYGSAENIPDRLNELYEYEIPAVGVSTAVFEGAELREIITTAK